VPEELGDEQSFHYAGPINDVIRDRLSDAGDHFVVANYLDVHPPFNASEEALQRFAPDRSRSDFPIGVRPERHIENDEKSYDAERMRTLYRAAIWELDRKIAHLIEEMLADDTFVIVTSDHGIWNSDTAYSDNRLHVPLVLFEPSTPARRVSETVSLQSLPATTMSVLTGDTGSFSGQSLLEVDTDQTAVAEILHHPNEVWERTGRVDVTKSPDPAATPQRDLVLVRGEARAEYVAGEWRETSGAAKTVADLEQRGEEILETPVRGTDASEHAYDAATKERLEALGYR